MVPAFLFSIVDEGFNVTNCGNGGLNTFGRHCIHSVACWAGTLPHSRKYTLSDVAVTCYIKQADRHEVTVQYNVRLGKMSNLFNFEHFMIFGAMRARSSISETAGLLGIEQLVDPFRGWAIVAGTGFHSYQLKTSVSSGHAITNTGQLSGKTLTGPTNLSSCCIMLMV